MEITRKLASLINKTGQQLTPIKRVWASCLMSSIVKFVFCCEIVISLSKNVLPLEPFSSDRLIIWNSLFVKIWPKIFAFIHYQASNTYSVHNAIGKFLKGYDMLLIVGDYSKPFQLKPRAKHSFNHLSDRTDATAKKISFQIYYFKCRNHHLLIKNLCIVRFFVPLNTQRGIQVHWQQYNVKRCHYVEWLRFVRFCFKFRIAKFSNIKIEHWQMAEHSRIF